MVSISLLNSYLDLDFDVLHAAPGNIYLDNIDARLIKLDPIASISNYKLIAGSGKHLEDVKHTPIISMVYKLKTSARNNDNLSIGFDRDRNRRQRELTKSKILKSKFRVRIMLNDTFGLADYQERATYVFGYKLPLIRNVDNAVLNKGNAINNAKIKINAIRWYVPHYTPNISNEAILSKRILSKTPT